MKFKYKATSISGGEQEGSIEAGNEEKAIELLQKHKLVIISIKPVKELFPFLKTIPLLHGVNSKKIVMFSKGLSVLLVSGISLVEALRIQYEQEENVYFREKIFAIAGMVGDGAPLSVALSRFPKIFSGFYINIIRSGEASGKLQESFLHLAGYIEKQYLLTSKVKNALMYPAVILGGFAIVGIGMMTFVVPQMLEIFKENKQELPLPTKVLVAVSGFMQNNFILVIIIIIVALYAVKAYAGTLEGKKKIDGLVLKMPIFSSLLKKFYLARFAENLSMLISSGIPIINALKISGDVVGNEVYKKVIYSSADEVKIGGSIAYAFERSDQVPPLVSKMMAVGERTGKLDVVLKDVSKFYTKEVDIAVDGLMALIEPILIFILAGGVGFLVAAILLPIYDMTSAI